MNKASSSPSNSQNIDETEQFFNQWRIYQQVIKNNDMLHQQIISAYQQFISHNLTTAFSVLDLGCGDSYTAAQLLPESNATHYTGVDVSTRALHYAEQNLQHLKIEKQFIANDLSTSIQNPDKYYDVILAGYSLHHLKLDEKDRFFEHCYAALQPGAYLFMYDLIRLQQETRQQCLQRHWDIYDKWHFDAQDKQLIKEHIFAQDYAESPEQIKALAHKHGFSQSEQLFTDANELFSAFSFKK